MAIPKKSLIRAATSKLEETGGASERRPESGPEQAVKSATDKQRAVAKLATVKLARAKLMTLRRIH
jgi:hypothetical protein